MVSAELNRALLELPVEDRLDLARQLIESVAWPEAINASVLEGIRRIEDIATGRIPGLTEEEFRAALQ